MEFKRCQMLYFDENYYNWEARTDDDDPYYISGAEHSELNRTEGHKVLYFIKHLVSKHWSNKTPGLAVYQYVEIMIRFHVPSDVLTHQKVADWIIKNWPGK